MRATGSLTTADGLTLFTRTYLPDAQLPTTQLPELPAPEPARPQEATARAAVILAHGYAEHSGRYEVFAEALAAAGYAVFAFDHRGHGRSGGGRASVRVFDEYVGDLGRVIDRVHETYPALPRFLFGHSMGGLVGLQLVLEHPEKVEGLLVTAAYMENAVKLSPLLTRAAPLISRLAPELPVQRLDTDALARDKSVVQAYRSDPLVYHGKVRARLGYELLRAGPYVLERAASIEVPVLLQHGGADRLAAPAGTQAVFAALGSSDKTLKLYDGAFHEILNDYGREQVLTDVLGWLEARA